MIPLSGLILFFLIRSKHRSGTWFFALAVGGACALNLLAKTIFHRARPTLWISPAPEYDYGFPSGHSMLTMAVVTALVLLTWRTRWRWPVFTCGGLFVLAVGLSRTYLGVHFPSDILAGWSASLAWVSSVYLVLLSRFPARRARITSDVGKAARPLVRHTHSRTKRIGDGD